MARNNKEILAMRLFSDKEKVIESLTPAELETKARWMYVMTQRLDNPMISNKKLVELLQSGILGSWTGVSQSTAYADIAAVTEMLGNVKAASKAWIRYTIIEGCKKAYEIAELKNDPIGMATALDKMGKYSRADKDDDAIDFTQMLPPVFEPTDDVTVLPGIEPLPDIEERRSRLRALHKGNLREYAEVVEPEEIEDEEG